MKKQDISEEYKDWTTVESEEDKLKKILKDIKEGKIDESKLKIFVTKHRIEMYYDDGSIDPKLFEEGIPEECIIYKYYYYSSSQYLMDILSLLFPKACMGGA